MEVFSWGPQFFTGIEIVDAQHHRLVDITNELGDVMLTEDAMSEGRMQILFKQLADYAREHFHDEEVLMRQVGVDARHVDQHVWHHHQFVEQLGAMWRARGAMKQPAETLHGFLSAWLAFHILGEDQAMARQMDRLRAGESAEIAYELEVQPRDNTTAELLKALHRLYHLLSLHSHDLADTHERLEKEMASRRSAYD